MQTIVRYLHSKVPTTKWILEAVPGMLAFVKTSNVEAVKEFVHQLNKFSCLLSCPSTSQPHRSCNTTTENLSHVAKHIVSAQIYKFIPVLQDQPSSC